MGDIADYYTYDQVPLEIFEEEELKEDLLKNPKKFIWTTKQGKEIPVADMSDRHIENAINWLKRENSAVGIRGVVIELWIFILKSEQKRRDEENLKLIDKIF